jgi:hypothetical protein
MKLTPVLLTFVAILAGIAANPLDPNAKINYFPDKCDVYACGWVGISISLGCSQ